MRFLRSKKGIALVTVVAAVAVSAVGAYGYFTTIGTGSGTVTAGNAASSGVEITLDATIGPGLIPGTSEPISFSATNASTTTDGFVISISLASASVTDVTSGTPNVACVSYLAANQDDFSLTGANVSAGSISEDKVVPKGGLVTDMPHGANLRWANNNAVDQTPCSGETLNVAVTSN